MSKSVLTEQNSEISAQKTSHAIVMGGSIAGLLAARVLLNHFQQVTLLDRDRFPESPAARPGVPQSVHVHALLLRGQQILEQLFPGILTELQQSGAQPLDWIGHWKFLSVWGWLEQHESGLTGLCCSRLLIEWSLRQRLLKYSNFQLRPGCYVKGLQTDSANPERIVGVTFQEAPTSTTEDNTQSAALQSIRATLVVDATGRQSKLKTYLSRIGYQPPTETSVNSFLGYASRWYKRSSNSVQSQSEQGIIIGAAPPNFSRGAVLYPVEGNRQIVTLSGIAGDRPPSDEAGFVSFIKSLRSPILYERLQDAEPCSRIYCYQRTENLWRHYEDIELPAGLVALGDAVCCFNPVYGQGMTAAALGATILDSLLAKRISSSTRERAEATAINKRFTRQFQRQLAAMLKTPWLMATGEDFRWSKTVGDRPGWISKQLQGYLDCVLQLSKADSAAHCAFIEVAHLTKSPIALFAPGLLWRVLAQRFAQNDKTSSR